MTAVCLILSISLIFSRYCLQMFTDSLPDLDRYDCYRRYLGDWFQAQKALHPRFSHRLFAARAGFSSSAFLPLILQKKRNLTDRHLEGFVRALDLSPRDAVLFRALVAKGNARDESTRRLAEDALRAARQAGVRRLVADQSQFYESWRHVAVHQALDCLEVGDDLAPLRAFLSPTPTLADVRRSLELLGRLGLARPDTHGIWRTTDTNLLGGAQLGPWVVREFQAQMFDLGRTAHERFPSGRRIERTETLAVGHAAAERIRERVRRCLDEIVEIAVSDAGPPDTLLQVNSQLFPLSETPRT